MNRTETVTYLTRVGEARKAWGEAHASVTADIFALMNRLLHEAAINRLSVEDVANLTGFTKGRLRVMMRNIGMNPKASRSLLSKQSAQTLAENATLLGIEPSEMDLMSPLAYLPMGSQMRRELADQSVSKVTEVIEHCPQCGDAIGYATRPCAVCNPSEADKFTALQDGTVVSGYASASEAVHDLHLRGGRLRYTCPVCTETPVEADKVSGNAEDIIAAVLRIHRPDDHVTPGKDPLCLGCYEAGGYDGAPSYPCDTARAVGVTA